jgi:micrococcal nuclease
MYEYRAHVIKVYDGDTITVNLDLGFFTWIKNQTIRLSGINTPEIKGEERPNGLISRDRLRELILDKEVIIKTEKDSKGKYGRWLGTIYLDEVNINEQLISEGLAEKYE